MGAGDAVRRARVFNGFARKDEWHRRFPGRERVYDFEDIDKPGYHQIS